jgi:hypothetical protein
MGLDIAASTEGAISTDIQSADRAWGSVKISRQHHQQNILLIEERSLVFHGGSLVRLL